MRCWIGIFLFTAGCASASAGDAFNRLVDLLPRTSNAVVLLDIDAAVASPLGKYEGWDKDPDLAYRAGMFRVCPQTARYALGAEIDFEGLKANWEAVALDLRSPVSTQEIAKARGGESDTIGGHAAVALPENRYLIEFDAKTLACLAPANRKLASNWVRDVDAKMGISSYLKKAADFSDRGSSEIIMALDLDGAFSLERMVAYLKKKPQVTEGEVSIQKAAKFLSSIQGVRLAIKLTQPPTAAVAIDCTVPAAMDAKLGKDVLLTLLSDGGLLVEDMRGWDCKTTEKEVTLVGKLSQKGLRQVLSLVESPTLPETVAASTKDPTDGFSSADPTKQMAEKTLKQFKEVNAMLDDLKEELKDTANLAVTATYFDRYARRAEKMPLLGVDGGMLDYTAEVSATLRRAALLVRNMGIQSNERQKQIVSSGWGTSYSYGHSAGYYGSSSWAVPTYDAAAESRGIEAQRRMVRAQEKANAATDVYGLRDQLLADRAAVRRSMTEKYQIEF